MQPMKPMSPMKPMEPMKPMAPMAPMKPAESDWWPAQLGSPGSTGSQNDRHYAYFPDAHRLAVKQGGEVKVYDTGSHHINGFGQQQGQGSSLSFSTGNGVVALTDLALVDPA